MPSKAEIDFILEIERQIRIFNEPCCWATPEEKLRFESMGISATAETNDTIGFYLLEGMPESDISLIYERDKIKRIKNNREREIARNMNRVGTWYDIARRYL
jgi:hypothetical protein